MIRLYSTYENSKPSWRAQASGLQEDPGLDENLGHRFMESPTLLRDHVDPSFRSFDVSLPHEPVQGTLGLPWRRPLQDQPHEGGPVQRSLRQCLQDDAGDPDPVVEPLCH